LVVHLSLPVLRFGLLPSDLVGSWSSLAGSG
jgi:hypothetical protein